MSTYIILSKISPDALKEPDDFRKMAETVKKKIRKNCPDVEWKDSYAVKGQFDVVDIVESDDPGQVDKASMIIRSHGRSDTQTMQASHWKDFLQSI
ncbi:MAG: GYD domain-containing protein [Cyclonatronaceae bacterium]